MRVTGPGHLIYAAAFAGLGVLSLISGDFAMNWQPVPAWVPWREALAYASGFVLFACGLGMLVKRTATLSALVLTINVLMWLVLLQAPKVVADPANEGVWLGFGETLVLVTGGWILLATLSMQEYKPPLKFAASAGGVRIAQILFALSLPVIGLSHFMFVQATADLVPKWLPDRRGFAHLTGAAHMAAGVGILFAIVPRLAATLEAIMLSLFTLLVWAPRVIAGPTIRFEWTALCASAAITGAAWAVADSLHGVAWGQVGWRSAEPAHHRMGLIAPAANAD
jgi:uncharacterized membrane protein